MNKVLVTKRVYPEAIELLRREAGVEVDYVGSDEGLAPEELITRAKGCRALVTQLTDKFPATVLERLDGVEILANVAVGYDNIDIPAATARGILVTNTPDVLTETTADFAWALMMAAARRIPEAHAFVHSGEWKKWIIDLLVGHDLFGRTLGVFGMGRIGQAFARRAQGFNMRVLYCDERPAAFGERVDKETLLREADFVSLHVPLTPATQHFIGAAELAMMKPTAILVNTARGPVVDEAALVEALRTGRIAAAGLDVFEEEPKVHPGLLELRNVALAPHIASASIDTRRRMSVMAAENALAALGGRRPRHLVNQAAWDARG